MVLFKILRGHKGKIPSTKTDGNCWYTTDESMLYIDYTDDDGTLQRKALNAKDAQTLSNASLSTSLNSSDTEIPTSKAVSTALSGKAQKSHASTETTYGVSSASNYGHAMASSTTPKSNGTAAVGSETAKFARGDHVHPSQTSVSGNAGTATKLATSRTISLTGDVTGSGSFDGSANLSITATVVDDSHNHIISNVDGLQTALDAKQATVTGAATTITGSNLTASRALISNSSGKVAVSDITSTELGYLDGVTSNVQTQLNNKSNTSHSHSLESLKLTDTVTGTQYVLNVTNGKLTMVEC